jgi:hypothetical protein
MKIAHENDPAKVHEAELTLYLFKSQLLFPIIHTIYIELA